MRRIPTFLGWTGVSGACLVFATLLSCGSTAGDRARTTTADLAPCDDAGSEAGCEGGSQEDGEGGSLDASILQTCEQAAPDQCSSCIASSFCPTASGSDPAIALACADVDNGWYSGGNNCALGKVLCNQAPADPWLGATVDDMQWPLSPAAPQPVLVVTPSALSSSTADLTVSGFEFDWVAPGATQNRMLNATTCVPSGLLGVTASADAVPSAGSPTAFSWADGTPTLAAAALSTGMTASQFTITAPDVGTTARLALYLAGATNGGHLSATLEGNTVDDPTASQWGDAVAYVIDYGALSGGSLTVTWSGSGPVTLLAAQLDAITDAPDLAGGTASPPPPPSLSGCFQQVDAGSDAGADAGDDAGVDAGADAGVDAGDDAGADAEADAGADAGDDAEGLAEGGAQLPISPASNPVTLPAPPANVLSVSFGVPWDQRVDSYYRKKLGVTTSTVVGNVLEAVGNTLADYGETLVWHPTVDSTPVNVKMAIVSDCAGRANEPMQFIACAASRSTQYISANYTFGTNGRQVGGLRTYCKTYAAFLYDIITYAASSLPGSVGYMQSNVVDWDGEGMIGPNGGHAVNYVTVKSDWSGVRSRYYFDAGHDQPLVFYPATELAISGVGSTPSDPNPSLVYPTTQGILNAIASGKTLPGNVTLRWSFNGPVAGMVCTKLNEPSEPASSTWEDNYVCASKDIGLKYSFAGPIKGMNCINTNEPSDVHQTSGVVFKSYNAFWADNYLCLPSDSKIGLSWGFAGAPGGTTRLWVMEPSEAWKSTWFDNVIYW
jgi:hypothetical protein